MPSIASDPPPYGLVSGCTWRSGNDREFGTAARSRQSSRGRHRPGVATRRPFWMAAVKAA